MDDERQQGRDARAPGESAHEQRVPSQGIYGQGIQAGDGNAQLNDFRSAQFVAAGGDVQAPSVTAGSSAEVAGRDIIKINVPSGKPAPTRIVTGSIPQAPPAFQPRADLLAQLRAAGPGTSVVYAITGLRGVGKTQIAAAYARECVNAGWRVVAWVNAETVPEALAGLALVAAALAIPTGNASLETVARQVRGRLEADGEGCLLVFDNVSDVAALRPYVPAAGNCQVVLTSTSESAATLGTPVAVDVFTEQESLAFLAARTGLSDPDGARQLASELGYLPLALAQAAAVIKAQRLTYSVYLERLRAFPLQEYLPAEDGGSYPRGLAEAILIAVGTVTATDKTGRCEAILDLVAVLSPAGVSRDLLYKAGEAELLARSRRGWLRRTARAARQEEVDSALGKLATASLLTLGGDASPTVTAHRLVMRVLRESRASDGTLAAAGDRACDLLTGVTGSLSEPWRDPPAARGFVQQVTALHEHLSPHLRDEDTALVKRLLTLRARALSCLNELGDSAAQAVELGQALVADRVRVLGGSHPDTLTTRYGLAVAYRAAGRVAEALALYEAVLADSERVLGESHPDTLTTRHSLAVAYRVAGRVAEAIPLLENVLAERVSGQGESHPHTLITRNQLAVAYQHADRVGEAITLYEAVLADQVRVLGESHPDTLVTRHNLGAAYRVAGRVGDAIPLLEHVLADRKQVLGESHPSTLTTRNQLAFAYRGAGRLSEAIALCEDVLADRVRVLGETHLDTLMTRQELAFAYWKTGRLSEAIPLLEATIAGLEATQGPDHPYTATARKNLARARAELQPE